MDPVCLVRALCQLHLLHSYAHPSQIATSAQVYFHMCVRVFATCVWLEVAAADASRLADGILVYDLLGSNVQNSFAKTWGISYAMSAITEWYVRRAV